MSGTALADSAGTASTPAQALRQRVDGLLSFLAEEPQATPGQLRGYLDRAVAPFIDFDRMASWIAGPLLRRMSNEQWRMFRSGLRENMLRGLAYGLKGYHPVGEVRYFPPRGDAASGDVTVGLGARGPLTVPVRLDFRLMRGSQGWRMVDVSANGFSAVAYYRAMVRSWVGQFGLEGALARLR